MLNLHVELAGGSDMANRSRRGQVC